VPLRTGLAAPIGLSFFTFKCISYVIDTYRDRRNGTRSFFELLLYISFFPQIMAGPITRFPAFRVQLSGRETSVRRSAEGLRRFIVGLGKKLLLAGAAAGVADRAFDASAASDARLAWLGAAAYMLQIYFDFSGYSDMAIGLGEMFGFSTPENFDHPYAAASITDFWRRWHISLSSWFRDYLYIPLGGSRKGRARAAANKFIVFVLCGLWHGAGWNYLLWGAWHGAFSAAETILDVNRRKTGRLRRGLGHLYTLLVVCVGFVLFRAENLPEGWRVLSAMLVGIPASTASVVVLHELLPPLRAALLIVGAVLALPVKKVCARFGATAAGRILSNAACLALLVLCLTRLAAGGFSPFIYFQF
jgi:alginate O-acetyltransferase complex protein AlgI